MPEEIETMDVRAIRLLNILKLGTPDAEPNLYLAGRG